MTNLEKFPIKTKVTNSVSCKDCVFLEKEKVAGNSKHCKDLGILESSKVCGSYRPNVYKLRSSKGSEEVIDLFKAIRSVPAELLPIIASLLARESKTRKFSEFKLLQPVMVNINGSGDHIRDYCKAYVLDADKEFIRFINKQGTLIAQFPIGSTSVLTLKQFSEIKPTLSTARIRKQRRDISRVGLISLNCLSVKTLVEPMGNCAISVPCLLIKRINSLSASRTYALQ
jgi:hypothetical protein